MGLKGSMSLGGKEVPCKSRETTQETKKVGNYHDLKGIINRPQKQNKRAELVLGLQVVKNKVRKNQ